MSNVRATVLEIAIPLKSKTANNIEHDYNLPFGIKGIAISLKTQTCFASCIDCLAIKLACLNCHGWRNRRNIASLRQIFRDVSALT